MGQLVKTLLAQPQIGYGESRAGALHRYEVHCVILLHITFLDRIDCQEAVKITLWVIEYIAEVSSLNPKSTIYPQ